MLASSPSKQRYPSVIILGIDPGSHNTGWGIISAEGTRLTCISAGVIRASSAATESPLSERLLRIADGLEALLSQYKPVAVSVETIFHAKNSQSAIKLGQARGAALLCAAR